MAAVALDDGGKAVQNYQRNLKKSPKHLSSRNPVNRPILCYGPSPPGQTKHPLPPPTCR